MTDPTTDPTATAAAGQSRDAGRMQRRCSATKADGSQCGGVPFRAHPTCWFHTPETAPDRAAGRRLGGSARSNRARAARELARAAMTPAEISGLLSLTLTRVIAGQTEPGVGNAAANIARAIIAVVEANAVEERLSLLEAAAKRHEPSGLRRIS